MIYLLMCLSLHSTCQPWTGRYLKPEVESFISMAPLPLSPISSTVPALSTFPKQLLKAENGTKHHFIFNRQGDQNSEKRKDPPMVPQQVWDFNSISCVSVNALFSSFLGSQRGQALISLISPQKPQVKVFMAWQLTKATSASMGHSLTLSSVCCFSNF